MAYGNMFGGISHNNESNNNNKKQLTQELGNKYENYIDQEELSLEINLQKLEMEVEKDKMELKSLIKESELKTEQFKNLLQEIAKSERARQVISYSDEKLEEALESDNQKDFIFKDHNETPGVYRLMKDRDARLGVIRSTNRVSALEMEHMYKESRELDGELLYTKGRIEKLKKEIESKSEKLEKGRDIEPLGDDLSLWN